MGDDGGRGIALAGVDHHLDIIGGEDLERAGQGRLGERMGVDADIERPVDAVLGPVLADRLADGQDMILIEGVVEGRSPMARGSEGDPLRWHARIRLAGEIGRDQPRHIDQHGGVGLLSRERADLAGHLSVSPNLPHRAQDTAMDVTPIAARGINAAARRSCEKLVQAKRSRPWIRLRWAPRLIQVWISLRWPAVSWALPRAIRPPEALAR